jgi:hypothetical protein
MEFNHKGINRQSKPRRGETLKPRGMPDPRMIVALRNKNEQGRRKREGEGEKHRREGESRNIPWWRAGRRREGRRRGDGEKPAQRKRTPCALPLPHHACASLPPHASPSPNPPGSALQRACRSSGLVVSSSPLQMFPVVLILGA